MPPASPLQRILHPLSVEAFAARFFEKRPLRLSGRSARGRRKFDFLFREEDFALGLDRVRDIKAVFENSREARIGPEDIDDMLAAGATICVNGMESAHAKLRAAARRVRSELNYAGEVTFRAYLSPPGSGFDLHYDARVATTLQIAGSKRWWYSKEPAVAFPMYNSGRDPDASVKYAAPKLRDMRVVVLQRGDVLCLPAGVWHRAEATGEGSLALNMAFDHGGASVFDSIVHVLRERTMADDAWRRPLPAQPRGSARTLPAPVAAVLRDRIRTLCAELSSLGEDEVKLQRAWRLALRRPQQR